MTTIETMDDCETITTPGSARLSRSLSNQPQPAVKPLTQKVSTHSVRAFRRIASASNGVRSDKLLASILAPRPPKRKGNNVTGQRGIEKCIFCVRSKKKCVFDPATEDDRCRRCQRMSLSCSEKRRPGGERALRRMIVAMEKATKQLTLAVAHEFEILPNDRWESYQKPYLTKKPMSTVRFDDLQGSTSVKESCHDLETFLRFLIFESKSWRPATNTSMIITLLPKDGFRRRFWVNGTLIGMRECSGKTTGEIRELTLMVERYPRFPTLESLKDYCWSRVPFVTASEEEIHVLAKSIDRRFGIIGKMDVREFTLRRKVKGSPRTGKRMVWLLQWDLPGEKNWGCSFWKLYLAEESSKRISWTSSRVACHVYLRKWLGNRSLPVPWSYDVLVKPTTPYIRHIETTRQAYHWLQILLDCVVLKKPAVLLSFEDDQITGLPEDLYDGVSFEDIRNSFQFGPPEKLNPNGTLAELVRPNFRLLPVYDARRIIAQISHITNDPNIHPPWLTTLINGQIFLSYQSRIPLKPIETIPSMLMITLQEDGVEFPSGFIGDNRDTISTSASQQVQRIPVAFKSSPTVMDPKDIQRAMNSERSVFEELLEPQSGSINELSGAIDSDAAAQQWALSMLNFKAVTPPSLVIKFAQDDEA